MHRGRLILGTVAGGALAVAAATQVASWSPDATGWDGYAPTGPAIESTAEPRPADHTSPPACELDPEQREAVLRLAEEDAVATNRGVDDTAVVVLCEEDR